MRSVTNATDISKLLYIPMIDEVDAETSIESSHNGIFIGVSRIYSMPFFLDPERLMNPHIFITGMTGSGKTYLTRNLMLKLYAELDCIVIAIDFTGEYREFADLFSSKRAVPKEIGGLIDEEKNRIVYVDLKPVSEESRISGAISILETVARCMRGRARNNKRRIFIILDEAWKLIGKSKPLETIIREGRKYKVGMIVASQNIGDLDMPFLSNMATIFIFRVQDNVSISTLQNNYGMRNEQVAMIQNLELGSCFVVQVNKHNARYAFCIKRVSGIDAAAPMKILIGDGMSIEVSMSRFESMVMEICHGSGASGVIARAKEHGFVRLDALIKDLIDTGAERRAILKELQEIGINDVDIADAFAMAVCTGCKPNER